MNVSKETKEALEQMNIAIGALSEMAGALRKHLMANGFSRKEAVQICAKLVVAQMSPLSQDKNDEM